MQRSDVIRVKRTTVTSVENGLQGAKTKAGRSFGKLVQRRGWHDPGSPGESSGSCLELTI